MTLDPANPGSLALVRELLGELLPLFSSRRVNIGLDETWELPRERLGEYFEWVATLRALPELEGREVIIWGDMFSGHADLVAQLPAGVTVCEWGYDAWYPFLERTALLAEAGIPFWVAPGTSAWLSIAGRVTNSITNCREAVEAALANGGSRVPQHRLGRSRPSSAAPDQRSGPRVRRGRVVVPRSQRRPRSRRRAQRACLRRSDRRARRRVARDRRRPLLAHTADSESLDARDAPVLPADPGRTRHLPRRRPSRSSTPVNGLLAARAPRSTARDPRRAGRRAPGRRGATGRSTCSELATDDALRAHWPATARSLRSREPCAAELAGRLDALIVRHRALWLARNRPGGLVDSAAWLENLGAAYRTGAPDPEWGGWPARFSSTAAGLCGVLVPEPGEVEAGRRMKRWFVSRVAPQLVEADHLDGGRGAADHVPRSGFEHEPERLHRHHPLVRHRELDLPTLVDAPRDTAKLTVRDAIPGPRVGVVHEPCREIVGVIGERERGRDRVEQLVARGERGCSKTEPVRDLRLSDEEQARASSVGQTREMGLEPVHQLDPPARAAGREDRHARFAQCFDVAQDRPFGHFELCGERRCSRSAPVAAARAACRAGARARIREVYEEPDSRCQVRDGRVCP